MKSMTGRLVDVVELALDDRSISIPKVAERDGLRVGQIVELLVYGPAAAAAVRARYYVQRATPADPPLSHRPSYIGELVLDVPTSDGWLPIMPVFGPQHVLRIVR